MTIFVFAKARFDESDERYSKRYGRDDDPRRYPRMIYNSVLSGRSRFGWSGGNGHPDPNAASPVLRRIKPGDWIVHVNTPEPGHCIAAKVLHGVDSDDGLVVAWGRDFRLYFDLDTGSLVEFDRRQAAKFDGDLYWQLRPRRKAQRVNTAVEDSFFRFLETIQRQ